jgi:hypothetical protein
MEREDSSAFFVCCEAESSLAVKDEEAAFTSDEEGTGGIF